MENQSRNKEENNTRLSSNSANEPVPVFLSDDSPEDSSNEQDKTSKERINPADDHQNRNDNTRKKRDNDE